MDYWILLMLVVWAKILPALFATLVEGNVVDPDPLKYFIYSLLNIGEMPPFLHGGLSNT